MSKALAECVHVGRMGRRTEVLRKWGKSRIEADMDNKRKEEEKNGSEEVTRERLAHVERERERRDSPDRQWLLPRVL